MVGGLRVTQYVVVDAQLSRVVWHGLTCHHEALGWQHLVRIKVRDSDLSLTALLNTLTVPLADIPFDVLYLSNETVQDTVEAACWIGVQIL